MLDVLLGEDIHDLWCGGHPLFRGTLLGTGGLVRAYSGAVKEGLLNSQIVEKFRAYQMDVRTGYTGVGKIQYILAQENITVMDSIYTDQVEFKLLVPVGVMKTWRSSSLRGPTAAPGWKKGRRDLVRYIK